MRRQTATARHCLCLTEDICNLNPRRGKSNGAEQRLPPRKAGKAACPPCHQIATLWLELLGLPQRFRPGATVLPLLRADGEAGDEIALQGEVDDESG